MMIRCLLAALVLGGCVQSGTSVTDPARQGAGWSWSLPFYFPTPKVPADNPMSEAKFQLGRALFYDARLSGNGQQSCSSCHDQSKAFTDGRAVSVGSTGESTARSAQGLANTAWHPTYTWANPSLATLERQMEVPLFAEHPVEMGVTEQNKATVLARIQSDAAYQRQFAEVFPGEPLTFTQIIKAIATFQRGMISATSKYDQYLQGQASLTPAELRGKDLFFGEQAECFHCHGSFNFNDQVVHAGSTWVETLFHNTGLYNIDGKGGFPEPNRGVFELSGKPADMGMFRAPGLRNVALTGPYMHDGSIGTLEEVLDFYAAGGREIKTGPHAGDGRLNPFKSDLIVRIQLSEQDKTNIFAFLKTLTDEKFITDRRFADPRSSQ